MFKEKLSLWIDAKFGEDRITLQKDGAMSHSTILFKIGVRRI